MTSSNGNISALLALCAGNSPVTGEFPSQRPVTRSFDIFFDLRLNKRLSKQSRGWWFDTPARSLWRHCNGSLRRVNCPWDLLDSKYNRIDVDSIWIRRFTLYKQHRKTEYNFAITASVNDLSPTWCQAITQNNEVSWWIEQSEPWYFLWSAPELTVE